MVIVTVRIVLIVTVADRLGIDLCLLKQEQHGNKNLFHNRIEVW